MENLDPVSRDHFSDLAARWWERDGPSRTLHDINPCRLDYVRNGRRLAGLSIADIGCGGGLLSEALARDGARVTAIDASPELIAVATVHAASEALEIDYRTALSSTLAASEPGRYDIVTCMELIEHVPDADALLSDCARLLAPQGELVVSTLNRHPAAYALGIVAAEYVLGLVPRGTHDYAQFLRPAELAACARRHGLVLEDVRGMRYNPFTRRARLGGPPLINYLARLRNTAAWT
ncbi:MAG: bifunctional 2-polyprenyl-6-hydroxyphenol methylase/3-demethylubiquinol 3-O-methyltransferase UbiG [Gammaproteobacteria bacterium]